MKEEWNTMLSSPIVQSAAKCVIWMHKLGTLTESEAEKMLIEYSQLNHRDDNNSPFPKGQWSVFIGEKGEHNPPHIHISNFQLNFVCKFDINTCKTIYEEGLTDKHAIFENRRKRTVNIQNMRGFTFEEISQRLKDWYKLPSRKMQYSKYGYSNYVAALTEWNDAYGDDLGIRTTFNFSRKL